MDHTDLLIEDTENIHFQYRIDDEKKIYSINYKDLELIPFFKKVLDSSKNKTNIFTLEKNTIVSDSIEKKIYEINTIEIHDFIEKYIEIWSDNLHDENYVNNKIKSNNPYHILEQKDIILLEDWINSFMNNKTVEEKKKIEQSRTYYDYCRIDSFGALLYNLSEYLFMEGIVKKIYIYISSILLNCSMDTMYEMHEDPLYSSLLV